MIDIVSAFEKHDDEYNRFDSIENKLHPRPDLCAFLLLDKLCPNDGREMVCCAEHDEIWLDIDIEKLSSVATDDDILMLMRCGIRYDVEAEAISMFV